MCGVTLLKSLIFVSLHTRSPLVHCRCLMVVGCGLLWEVLVSCLKNRLTRLSRMYDDRQTKAASRPTIKKDGTTKKNVDNKQGSFSFVIYHF
jgi:hypothetical protein